MERNESSVGIMIQLMHTSDESNARDYWIQMVGPYEGLQPSMWSDPSAVETIRR